MPTPTFVVAYMPVFHAGYLRFFKRFEGVEGIYLLGPDIIAEFDYLRKEIRALDPDVAVSSLRAVIQNKNIGVITIQGLRSIAISGSIIVMPDEDVCRELAKRYLVPARTVFHPTFLRWNRNNILTEKTPSPDRAISVDDIDHELMALAEHEGQKSSDWWRQVGAVLVRNKEPLIVAHNQHLPTEYAPYIDGDPRNAFSKGVHIELGTAIHAEKAVLCESARRGIATLGADLYVSTFPCPPCSKDVALSGIARVYYREGYAMLDGERVLRDASIEIVHVGRQ